MPHRIQGAGDSCQPGHGLGIDAGGTYTDAVVFDFGRRDVIAKSKAPTTKWDFTLGIAAALDSLDVALLAQSRIVAVSTTLATNAIVEGHGQEVGLLVMPPYGHFDASRFTHKPIAVIDGRLEIDGVELAPVSREQAVAAARDMMERHQVKAFAVAGYASHANPAHELLIKDALREETGLSVTCGHDVSEGLNYRIRAETAALNARIIPCLETFLKTLHAELNRRGIAAPVMVVKSDGSLMGIEAALKTPVETILSGPAASVAGARHLSGLRDAIIVDMGGTTTDTAVVADGVAQTCEEGADVGGWRTHVRALRIRTLGLGGDSRIAVERGELTIGPRRVVPVSWLGHEGDSALRALDWLVHNVQGFDVSTLGLELIALNGRVRMEGLSDAEKRIVDALEGGPLSSEELAHRLGGLSHHFLPLARLEQQHWVQRCALTPTDLLHVDGQLDLWDTEAAKRLTALYARLMNQDEAQFARYALDQVVARLATELLKKVLDDETAAGEMDDSPLAQALLSRAFGGARGQLEVGLRLRCPVVGVGAPAHCHVPRAAALLGTEGIIPPHADVANAVGAVTGNVFVHRQVRIIVDETGKHTVTGLENAPTFGSLDAAAEFAIRELSRLVCALAQQAGTRADDVEIVTEDHAANAADGRSVFLERRVEARISGPPTPEPLKSPVR